MIYKYLATKNDCNYDKSCLPQGQLEFKENGNGSGNGKRERELVKIVVIHRILYQ